MCWSTHQMNALASPDTTVENMCINSSWSHWVENASRRMYGSHRSVYHAALLPAASKPSCLSFSTGTIGAVSHSFELNFGRGHAVLFERALCSLSCCLTLAGDLSIFFFIHSKQFLFQQFYCMLDSFPQPAMLREKNSLCGAQRTPITTSCNIQ